MCIIEKIGVPDWAEEQRRRLWRWAGHTAKREDGRWTRAVLVWLPNGIRKRGHPKRRWEDALLEFWIAEYGCTKWRAAAQDRDQWKAMERHFAEYHRG